MTSVIMENYPKYLNEKSYYDVLHGYSHALKYIDPMMSSPYPLYETVLIEHIRDVFIPIDEKGTYELKNVEHILFGYTNLKIIGSYDKVDRVAFTLDGRVINAVFPSLTGGITCNIPELEPLSNAVIPASMVQNFVLVIESMVGLIIEYDIVKITNFNTIITPRTKTIDYLFSQWEYNGSDTVYFGENQNKSQQIKINHDLPIKRLVIRSDKPINNLSFLMGDVCLITPKQIDSCTYVHNFEYPIDLSRIKKQILSFDIEEDETTVSILTEAMNILRCGPSLMSIAYGVAFSRVCDR